MNKKPTRRDVAKLAGVSTATVSYVVNNGPRPVAETTRQNVLNAINALGYKPDPIARSLRTGSTQTVGVLIPNVVAGYFGYLVTDIELSLAKRGYSMILASSLENRTREAEMLNVLATRSIDGLLHVPISHKNDGSIEELISDGIPVVFMDRYSVGVNNDVVMTDNVHAARSVTNHLIKNGCKRIVCISFHEEASSAQSRVEGYKQGLFENGIMADETMILRTHWPFGQSVETMLNFHIETYGPPDGIFCTAEGLIADSIRVLRKRGLYGNCQIQVAGGFTGSEFPWHDLLERPIPIVRQNTKMIAERSVDLLIKRISGDTSAPQVELIPADLVV